MGGLPRVQAQARKILDNYDLMICVGADVLRMSVFSEVDPLPESMSVIQVGLRDWEMGKNYPTELAIRADVKTTLQSLVPVVSSMQSLNKKHKPILHCQNCEIKTGAHNESDIGKRCWAQPILMQGQSIPSC